MERVSKYVGGACYLLLILLCLFYYSETARLQKLTSAQEVVIDTNKKVIEALQEDQRRIKLWWIGSALLTASKASWRPMNICGKKRKAKIRWWAIGLLSLFLFLLSGCSRPLEVQPPMRNHWIPQNLLLPTPIPEWQGKKNEDLVIYVLELITALNAANEDKAAIQKIVSEAE